MKVWMLMFVNVYFSVVSGFFVRNPKMTKEEVDNDHQEKHKFYPEMNRRHFKKHEDYFKEVDSLAYLTKYGYLPLVSDNTHNVFSKTAAVLAFQRFANLPQTGVIDEETEAKMKQPRCGMRDVQDTPKNYKLGPSKWEKTDLTYRITKYTKDISEDVQRSELAKAFKYWSDVSPLTFTQLTTGNADIMIKFVVKDHGDGYDFDGKGNVLAHAFYPANGNAHFDDDEPWTSKSNSGINLLAVATHEFGHSLGLDHSNIDTAIMAPFYNGYQENLKLDKDDVEAIQKWYGPKKEVPTTPAPPPTTTLPKTTPPPTTPAPPPTTTLPKTTPPTTTPTTTPEPTTTPAPTTTQAPTTPTTTLPKTTTTITTSQPTTPTLTTTILTKAVTTLANTQTTTSMTSTIPSTSKVIQTTESFTTTLPTTTVRSTVPASTTTPMIPKDPKYTPHNFPCPFRFGAIMTDPSGMSIAFAGSYFVYINKQGRVYPVRHHIRSKFRQGPSYVHAAAHDAATNSTFLFRNRSVWKYSEGKLTPGFPKYLGIFPLAAVIDNGQLMLLTTSYIYHLDKNTMHWLTYPINIRVQYPGIPYYFRAAVSFGHGYVYFFRWRKIYELDMYTGQISQMDC